MASALDLCAEFVLEQRALMARLIGHRGAAAYAPENTLAAFQKAHSLGCRWIEFDVMLSSDGEAFVFHDDNLKRTTNGRGDVGLVTAEYIRSLDAGSWYSKSFRGETIPSLQEAIAWLVASGVDANIEIKPYPGSSEETVTTVLSQINRYWPQEKTWPLLSSFDLEALRFCQRLAPEIPLGLLLDKWHDQGLAWARELNCFSVHLSKRAATAARVAALKNEGYAVYVYTINRRRKAHQLFKWGVDAVFSDYPDLLK